MFSYLMKFVQPRSLNIPKFNGKIYLVLALIVTGKFKAFLCLYNNKKGTNYTLIKF